jgi:squalene cyclase
MIKPPRFITIVITIFLWLPSLQGYCQEATGKGIQWLTSVQKTDGFWGDEFGTALRDTTVIADTFQLLNPTAASYSTSIQWLATASLLINYDYVSRRLYTFSRTSNDLSLDLYYLKSGQKPDSGWGLDIDHECDVLDTALALRALAAVGSTDVAAISGAVSYLLGAQNTDGGWGFVAGDGSRVYYTAIVMQALETQGQSTTITNSLSRATTYLLGQQISDGSWNNVADTALAFMAISKTTGNVPERSAAIQYLLGRQQANGSWNDDSYSTALALQALKAGTL